MALIDLIAGQQKNVTNVFDQFQKGKLEKQQMDMNQLKIGAAQRQADQEKELDTYQQKLLKASPDQKAKIKADMVSAGHAKAVNDMTVALGNIDVSKQKELAKHSTELYKMKKQYIAAKDDVTKADIYQKMIDYGLKSNLIKDEFPQNHIEAEKSGWLNNQFTELDISKEAYKRTSEKRRQDAIEKSRKAQLGLGYSRLKMRKDELKQRKAESKERLTEKKKIDTRNFQFKVQKEKNLQEYRKLMINKKGSGANPKLTQAHRMMDKYKDSTTKEGKDRYHQWSYKAQNIATGRRVLTPRDTFKGYLKYFAKSPLSGEARDKQDIVDDATRLSKLAHPEYDFDKDKHKEDIKTVEKEVKLTKPETTVPTTTKRVVGKTYTVGDQKLIWTESNGQFGWTKAK